MKHFDHSFQCANDTPLPHQHYSSFPCLFPTDILASEKLHSLNFLYCPLFAAAAAAAKSLQSCLTLCDPIDGSPPGSCPWDSPGKNTGVGCHFLLQCLKVKSESEVAQSCPWTAAYQAPPSIGFPRKEYCSGVPLPSPCPLFTVFSLKYKIHKGRDFCLSLNDVVPIPRTMLCTW